MANFVVQREVSVEAAEQALTNALGPSYRVISSGSTLKVKRNPVMTANVDVASSQGETTFRITGGGLVLVKLLDSLTIVPKIREALGRELFS